MQLLAKYGFIFFPQFISGREKVMRRKVDSRSDFARQFDAIIPGSFGCKPEHCGAPRFVLRRMTIVKSLCSFADNSRNLRERASPARFYYRVPPIFLLVIVTVTLSARYRPRAYILHLPTFTISLFLRKRGAHYCAHAYFVMGSLLHRRCGLNGL